MNASNIFAIFFMIFCVAFIFALQRVVKAAITEAKLLKKELEK